MEFRKWIKQTRAELFLIIAKKLYFFISILLQRPSLSIYFFARYIISCILQSRKSQSWFYTLIDFCQLFKTYSIAANSKKAIDILI